MENFKRITPKEKVKNGHKRSLSQVDVDREIKKATEKYNKRM